MVTRVARNLASACVAMAALSTLWRPGDWRLPLGVLGGGALVGLSFRAIATSADSLARPDRRRSWRLVKFFTRYGILALAAYAMMVRFELDPVGMLVGVTSLGLAFGIEAVRGFATTRTGGHD
jgi:hypothetical protein